VDFSFSELIGWALTLLGIFSTLVFGLVKLLLAQFEKRLATSFAAQEDARQSAKTHWDENFSKVLAKQEKEAAAVKQLEHSFLHFKAELPLHYVRRDDYVRTQTIIEAKIDRVVSKLDTIQARSINP
jgi:uncharacterized membrane protein YhiD involved in acid resistance